MSYTIDVVFPDRFYEIKDIFTGQPGGPFFDNIDFRAYLNKFFKVGRTLFGFAGTDDCHWTFRRRIGGRVIDSRELRTQPEQDMHCTLFSLHTELSALEPGVVGKLKVVENSIDYIQNLIVLYEMLIYVFTCKKIKNRILNFKPWRCSGKNRDWIEVCGYIEAVNEQLDILQQMKDRAIKEQN